MYGDITKILFLLGILIIKRDACLEEPYTSWPCPFDHLPNNCGEGHLAGKTGDVLGPIIDFRCLLKIKAESSE